jgi:copper(I)-binding protein
MNKLQKVANVAVIALLFAASALGAEPVTTANAWVRATVPGQSVAGAYFDITSATLSSLVSVESVAAGKAELHTMSMDGGVMKMRAVQKIELPARQTVSLKPGGYHVMLLDIKRELKAGERVPMKLVVQDGKGVKTTLNVEAEVRATAPPAQHAK